MDTVEWTEEKRRVKRVVDHEEARRRQVAAQVLDRVNAHVVFLDFQRQQQKQRVQALRQQQQQLQVLNKDAHEADPLGFLADVNADDMRSLLEAESPQLSTPHTSPPPPKTIEMPPEILHGGTIPSALSTTLTPTVAAVLSTTSSSSLAALLVTSAATPTTSVAASASSTSLLTSSPCSIALTGSTMNVEVTSSLASDEKVNELMDSLDIGLRGYGSSHDEDDQEIAKNKKTQLNEAVKTKTRDPAQASTMTKTSSVLVDPKEMAVVHEMHAWVSGDRDPELVKQRNAKEREEIAKSLGLNRKHVRRCTVRGLEQKKSEKAIARILSKDGDVIVVSSDSDEESSGSSSKKAESLKTLNIKQLSAGGSELLSRRRQRVPSKRRVVSSSSGSSSSEYSGAEDPEESDASSSDSVLSDDVYLDHDKSNRKRRSTSGRKKGTTTKRRKSTSTKRRIRRYSDTLKSQRPGSTVASTGGKKLRISTPQLPLQAPSEESDSGSEAGSPAGNCSDHEDSMQVGVEEDLLDPSQDAIPDLKNAVVVDLSNKSSASNTSPSSASSSSSSDSDSSGESENESQEAGLKASAQELASSFPVESETNAKQEESEANEGEDGIDGIDFGSNDSDNSDNDQEGAQAPDQPNTNDSDGKLTAEDATGSRGVKEVLDDAAVHRLEDDEASEADTVDLDSVEMCSDLEEDDDEDEKPILTAQREVSSEVKTEVTKAKESTVVSDKYDQIAASQEPGSTTSAMQNALDKADVEDPQGEQGDVSEAETVDLEGPEEEDDLLDGDREQANVKKYERTEEQDSHDSDQGCKSKTGLERAFDLPSGMRLMKKSKSFSKPMKTNTTPKDTPAPTTTPVSTSENRSRDEVVRNKNHAVEVMSVMKGRYQFQRRTIKMMDEPPPKRDTNRCKDGKKNSSSGEPAKETVVEDPRITARRRQPTADTTPKPVEPRYLNYDDERSKSQSWVFSSSSSTAHTMNGSGKAFPRDRQLSIYDALAIEEPDSNRSLASHGIGAQKRPSPFIKAQEEAAKNGVSLVQSTPKSKNWIDDPIPRRQHPSAVIPDTPDNKKCRGNSNSPNAGGHDRERRSTKHGSENGNASQSKRSPKNGNQRSKNGSSSKERPTWNKDEREQQQKKRQWDNRSKNPRERFHRDDRRGQVRDYPRNRDRFQQRERDRGQERPDYHTRDDSRRQDRGYESNKRDRSDSCSSGENTPRKRTRSIDRLSNATFYESPSRKGDRDRDRHDRDPDKDRRNRDGDRPHGIRPSNGRDPQLKRRETWDPQALTLFERDNVFVSDSDEEEEVSPKGPNPLQLQPRAHHDHDESLEKRRFYCVDLERIPVDESVLKRSVYVSNVNPKMSEQVLEELFTQFGLETNKETGFPQVDVFLCQRNHRPRGDARVVFTTPRGVQQAIEERNALMIMNSRLQVRPMDRPTQRILIAQFDQVRAIWTCRNTDCHEQVSVWRDKCDKCMHRRVFPPNPVAIQSTDWLCSICFTPNAESSTICRGCHIQLPQRPRTEFYQ